MSKILVLDASTTGCSIALFENQNLIAATQSRQARSSAEMLTTFIEQTLVNANTDYKDLTAIAVSKGPGSYTGLRIAVSTAKGLAFGLDIPLISFGTLPLLCEQIGMYETMLLCPMIDARRMEVFCGFYDADTKQNLVAVSAEIVNEDSFKPLLEKNRVLFFGEGAKKCQDVIQHKNALFLNEIIYPDVSFAGKIIDEKYTKQEFEDLASFEPYYLKEYMFKTKKQ